MQNVELYILGDLVQLKGSENIALTLRASDIAQINSIVSNFTTGFKILPTKNNTSVLEFVNQINSGTTLPYTRSAAKLKVDGVWIIQDGFITVDSVQGDIELTIYDNQIDFFSQLDKQLLSDLDLSALNEEWQQTEVTSKLINTYTDGLTYPVIQYGVNPLLESTFLTASGDQDISFMLPSVYAKTAIQAIINTTDYTIEPASIFYNSVDFENIILPYARDEIQSRFRAVDTGGETLDNSAGGTPTTFTLTYENSGTFSGGTLQGSGRFKATAGETKTRCYFSGTIDNSGSTFDVTVQLVLLDETLALDTVLDSIVLIASGGSAPVSLSSGDVTVLKDYSLAVQVIVGAGDVITLSAGYEFKGGYIFANELLPDIESIELLRSVFVLYGVIPSVNPITKIIDFIQFETIASNTSIDWSSKIDLAIKPKLEFTIGNYAQTNYAYYASSDNITESNTKGSFTIDNVNINNTVDLFQLQFFGCNDTTGINIQSVIHLPKYTEVDTFIQPTDNIDIERIVYLSVTQTAIDFTDGITITNSTYKAAQFEYFLFDAVFSGSDYTSLTTLLQEAKKLTANFKLTAVDIASIDFFKPIYLNVNSNNESINGLFYIDTVSNYVNNKSTGVTLIKF